MDKPWAIIAVAAVVADTDEEAEFLAGTYDLNWLRRAKGEMLPLPSPQEAAAYPWTEQERRYIARRRARLFCGSAQTVSERLRLFAADTEADEIMITSSIWDHALRKRSYELLAAEWGRLREVA